ncbi:PaaI family thioesterase [Legionella micdadei]|uniref:DUF4442 domain-containing protein n=1 Tax=Legionella micdadei TaxID=451 RepID=A0A098GEH2_LEGMI|nr:DUF4442 domain-containing protein [Legionella micdadei]ARG98436.1 hypothetical protein B6N58_12650 [Legionella micdadei]ARH01182.1 hypothetical protein B6V88_12655 [Legionella micdadei]KTD30353.1 aromatic compounds catabolism [Legionella micdadei]NSL18371.1 DUF4442 domain-containing protein [Legionella micdadei]CEG59876.1 conserved protein of unknown function [Legionella micdadei]
MNLLTRFKLFLWTFGHFKVPLIGHLRPKLISIDDKRVIVKLPLGRRSKNHLNSMYFGALAVGADLAGGLHGFYYANQLKLKISLVFKSFQAQFLHRPESDVYFICDGGKEVKAMIEESEKTGQRINNPLKIKAFTHYPENPEEVADFILELSVKVLAS